MTDNVFMLAVVAVAIPFFVMGGLWLFARAMDRVVPSRKAKLAIWGSLFTICVAQAAYGYIHGRSSWWDTAMAIVAGVGWFLEYRQKNVWDSSVGLRHG